MTDQFIGKVLADKYRIDSLLSENELGNFYRGTHLSMEKPVSIKVLPALASDDSSVKRFADEARTVSRISHPNILNVTDYGSDKDKTIFIIYDEADGETLKDLIKQNGKFPLERVNNIVQKTASGLSIAHVNGVIHQNLTSENVLIKDTGSNSDEVKILNFGTAQIVNSENVVEYSSKSEEYFSPEHYSAGKIDERSDIYSLGIITYEMLAGEVPFKTDKSIIILGNKKDQPPPPLSAYRKDLPPEVEHVLLTALAQNPDARYQTVREFAAAFNKAASNQSLSAPVGAAAVKEIPQNNIWKTAFIVLAGISLLAAFFIYTTQTKQADPATQLMTDANGIPVQPVNPATGTTEQSMSNMNTFNPEMFNNTNGMTMMPMPPGGTTTTTVAPGGDGYDPWATGKPPAGAPPTYVGPGGQQVYVDGNGSIFMPSDNNTYIMVPKNTNAASNVNTQARGRNSNTNTNTATAPANTGVKPPANTATNTATPQVKPSPSPNTKPSPAKPSPSPKKPAAQDPD